jgi:hypothetical protein
MSKKNQLFKIVPDKHILNLLLEAFGLESLEDSRFFTKQNMIECDTLEKILEMKGELESYYIPCKRKVYLEKVTDKKCITILRQFLKSYNYKCMGIEKSIKGQKQMTYRLLPMDKEQVTHSLHGTREYVIDFSV